MKVRALDSAQTVAFDTEYVTPERWASVRNALVQQFHDKSLNVLDIGGGNGVFADKLLDLPFVQTVTVIDREASLLQRNAPHPRKHLVNVPFEDFQPAQSFDLVVMNWLLHHLVGNSYSECLTNINLALRLAQRLLKPGGTIFVYENMYNDLLDRNISSYLIYKLTASRTLSPITRRLGANTAGVGVCFQSESAWHRIFSQSGLQVVDFGRDPGDWSVSLVRRVAFLLRNVNCAYFLLRPKLTATDP